MDFENQSIDCSSTTEELGRQDKSGSSCDPKTVNVYNLEEFFEKTHPSLISHKTFLLEHDEGKIYCNVCLMDIDSILDLPEHLETKSHGDNIIMSLRGLLPLSLQKNLDFVVFNKSNLHCSICKYKSHWCSENPHRTILDIIIHNDSENHLTKQTKTNQIPSYDSSLPLLILKSIAEVNPLVNDNIHFIHYQVQPCFKCKLCSKVIDFEEDEKQLSVNFSLHLNSVGHKRCSEAFFILQSSKQKHNLSKYSTKHNLSVVRSKIFCSSCDCYFDPSEQNVLEHVGQSLVDESPKTDSVSEASYSSYESLGNLMQNVSALSLSNNTKRFIETSENCTSLSSGDEINVEPSPSRYTSPLKKGYERLEKVKEMQSKITNHNVNEDISYTLKKLENEDFFVSKVSKYLVSSNMKVQCDVCERVISTSCNGQVLKENIKSHFTNEIHKNFMEKITCDQKDIICKLIFQNPQIDANKQYIKASGKYLHCMLCQFSVDLSLDYESLQKKLAMHCLGKYHLNEIGKPYNSVFDKSSEATKPPLTVSKVRTSSENSVEEVSNDISNKLPSGAEDVKSKTPTSALSNRSKLMSRPLRDNSFIPTADKKSLLNDPNAIKINGLNSETSANDFFAFVKKYGPVRHFYLATDRETNTCKGFALVHYQSRQAAEQALSNLNSLQTKFGMLQVKWAY